MINLDTVTHSVYRTHSVFRTRSETQRTAFSRSNLTEKNSGMCIKNLNLFPTHLNFFFIWYTGRRKSGYSVENDSAEEAGFTKPRDQSLCMVLRFFMHKHEQLLHQGKIGEALVCDCRRWGWQNEEVWRLRHRIVFRPAGETMCTFHDSRPYYASS